MKYLALILLGFSAFAQQTSQENQTRDRGQTRPQDESQSWTRGRLGTQQPIPYKLQDFSGVLVDASCGDRTARNLRRIPAPPDIAPPPNPDAPVKNPEPGADRADAMEHQVPDLLSRQPDPSCAVTGSTRAFALLMPNGRLLNLDEGGITLVTQALNSLPEGRAMLSGAGPAVKPKMTLRGRVNGDRLVVENIVKR